MVVRADKGDMGRAIVYTLGGKKSRSTWLAVIQRRNNLISDRKSIGSCETSTLCNHLRIQKFDCYGSKTPKPMQRICCMSLHSIGSECLSPFSKRMCAKFVDWHWKECNRFVPILVPRRILRTRHNSTTVHVPSYSRSSNPAYRYSGSTVNWVSIFALQYGSTLY